jgi:hypothetical protein
MSPTNPISKELNPKHELGLFSNSCQCLNRSSCTHHVVIKSSHKSQVILYICHPNTIVCFYFSSKVSKVSKSSSLDMICWIEEINIHYNCIIHVPPLGQSRIWSRDRWNKRRAVYHYATETDILAFQFILLLSIYCRWEKPTIYLKIATRVLDQDKRSNSSLETSLIFTVGGCLWNRQCQTRFYFSTLCTLERVNVKGKLFENYHPWF